MAWFEEVTKLHSISEAYGTHRYSMVSELEDWTTQVILMPDISFAYLWGVFPPSPPEA
jgi:hypothetical protein